MKPATLPCLDDADLYALVNGQAASAQIESHLIACPHCQARLERLRSDLRLYADVAAKSQDPPARAPISGGSSVSDPIPVKHGLTAEVFPTRIGPYQVLGLLSKGGQALVFRVLHPTFQKEMVLKLSHHPLPPGESNGDRLVEEGRLLSEMNHPNLVHVYDLNFFEEKPYLVLEFIRGRTLQQVASQQRFTWREAARLIAKVARALEPAHAKGVYHRDITPRNIIVDEQGEPRLIDFGLSRFGGAWNESAEPLNVVAGTHGFMAPEQAKGNNDLIDARSDVYALGAVLRFSLMSRPLGSAAGADPTELLISADGAGAAPDRALMKQAGIPRPLQRIICLAMEENPAQRYQSAQEMAVALERAARDRAWPIWALTVFGVACLTASAVLIWHRPAPPAWTPPEFQEVLHRADSDVSLLHGLPIDAMTHFFLRAQVPAGHDAIILIRGPDGRVRQITDFTRGDSAAPGIDTFRYTIPRTLPELIGASTQPESGTVLVVMISRQEPFAPREVEELEKLVASQPLLKPLALHMWSIQGRDAYPGENQTRGDSDESPEANDGEVAQALDDMLAKLKQKNLYVTGVAVPYRASPRLPRPDGDATPSPAQKP
jgi:tRNA A-37 threonylcarbamoyl transferase component Bud32